MATTERPEEQLTVAPIVGPDDERLRRERPPHWDQ